MKKDSGKNVMKKVSERIIGTDPRKRFIKFIFLLLGGWVVGYLTIHRGTVLTPEIFKDCVLSLGITGPAAYISIFVVRPFILIPSIFLFIAGGLAFGPLWGPVYASLGAAMGGTLGFVVARRMGQEYVMGKLKWNSSAVINRQYSFSIVFLLSLFPFMPVAAINYGSGLSKMKFRNYFSAHLLGLTPRVFAYGFFGSVLLDTGSSEFRVAVSALLLMALVTAFFHWRFRPSRMASVKYASSGSDSG